MAHVRAAILNASLQADRMHKQFDAKDRADAGEGRIDVFDMLVQNEIPVMFQTVPEIISFVYHADSRYVACAGWQSPEQVR